MIFVKKYPLLIALLLPFSFGLPSSAGGDGSAKTPERLQIGPIHIYIMCYFNADDPRCKDERNGNPNTDESSAPPISDKPDSDEQDDDNVVTNEDNDLGSPVAEVSDDADTDTSLKPPTSSKDRVDEMLFYYEPPADSSKYDDLERYSRYWSGRTVLRDHLCTVCLAAITQPEITLEMLKDASRSFWLELGYTGEKFIYTIVRLVVSLPFCLLYILFPRLSNHHCYLKVNYLLLPFYKTS